MIFYRTSLRGLWVIYLFALFLMASPSNSKKNLFKGSNWDPITSDAKIFQIIIEFSKEILKFAWVFDRYLKSDLARDLAHQLDLWSKICG